jgi:hypothetical protein
MLSRPQSVLAVALCLIAGATCEQSVAPAPSSGIALGSYVLATVNGTALPTSVSLGLNCQMAVDSGRLLLLATGRFDLNYRGLTNVCALPGSGNRWTAQYVGTSQLAVDSVRFTLDAPNDTIRFAAHRTSSTTLAALVPQLPGAVGPPVALTYRYTGPL